MSNLDAKYAFRSEMVDRLVEDLYGPSSPDEVLTERPLERYVTGVLWPAADDTLEDAPDEPESAAVEAGDSADDSPVANARLTYPTSLGLTVSVDLARATSIRVIPQAAQYIPTLSAVQDPRRRSDSYEWRRAPIEGLPVTIDLLKSGRQITNIEGGGLELYALVRPSQNDVVTVTLALRNRRPKQDGEDRDQASWFQVGLTVEADAPALADRSKLRTDVSPDEDLASSELLYRNQMVFGAGHGCAVTWHPDDVHEDCCRKVSTTFIPRQEVSRSMAGGTHADLRLGLLSSGSRDEVLEQLEALVRDYSEWISATRSSSENGGGPSAVPAHLQPTAEKHLDSAEESRDRIQAGIDLLRTSDEAFTAFQLANRAMHFQRSRQDWVRAGRPGEFSLGDDQSWRPFQIAFILLNLPSVTDEDHPERDFADLLWFPTGGGKTEAYLGLIAYCLLLRRLRDSMVSGVAVIMRYTLRLLTIQQFERAAMLICSLEHVRKTAAENLGDASFGIGLWVGAAATPNDTKEARRNLGKLRNGEDVVEGNPCQIEACPWCGSRLTVDNYVIEKQPFERMKVSCPNWDCDYRSGLPVHIVDTDVYRERPELVIGTVDKFARMAWKGDVANIFGRVHAGEPGPDLIIQDELHLISGPLGSTVGLFETAVDLASSSVGRAGGAEGAVRRPKVIASTATIRRADAQIRAVFNRTSRLFPQPGTDPNDSFFAEQAPRAEYGTREYVGVMAAGTSHATLMVRTYASLLHSASVLEGDDATRDPYWTLMGYFNSLRVLGSAYLQVYDDVRARLKLLASREGISEAREVELSELTSRVSSNLIPGALKSLETGLGDARTPDDVVLATNMISVGLDVDRLGLMAVMGQPQSNAEYIQATSRVGRKHPGLVVTIFNSAKSRDRSHYEGFIPYHQALYRAVEATSATPFAARSRDRALHAVMVSALRMMEGRLRDDDRPGNISKTGSSVEQVFEFIRDRVAAIQPEDADATSLELENLLATWRKAAAINPKLRYWGMRDPGNSLLIDFAKALEDPDYRPTTTETPWPTPSSMRDVDAETTLRPIWVRKDSNA